MLPSKILDLLDAERFDVVEVLVLDAMANRLDVAPVQAHEKDIENRCDDMEMLSQGQKTQEKEKTQVVDEIGRQMDLLQLSPPVWSPAFF